MAWGDRLRHGTTKLAMLNVNLSFPHLVWAIGLSLLLAQSGLLARIVTRLGWIDMPADVPVLIRDRFGFGIILDYVTKETPFLVLILLSVLRSQPEAYAIVAENLGAIAGSACVYVTLPLVMPALMAGSVLVFAFIFGAYEVPAVLGVRYPTDVVGAGLEFFANPDLNSRAEGMAISVIMALVVLVGSVDRSQAKPSGGDLMRWIRRGGMTAVVLVLLVAPIGVFALYGFSTSYFYPQFIPTTWTVAPLYAPTRRSTDAHRRSCSAVQIATIVSHAITRRRLSCRANAGHAPVCGQKHCVSPAVRADRRPSYGNWHRPQYPVLAPRSRRNHARRRSGASDSRAAVCGFHAGGRVRSVRSAL